MIARVTTALRDLVRVDPKADLIVLSTPNSLEVSCRSFVSVQSGMSAVLDHEKGILGSQGIGQFKFIMVISTMSEQSIHALEEDLQDLALYLKPSEEVGKLSQTVVAPKFISVSIGGQPGSNYSVESPTDIVTLLPALFVDRCVVRRHGA